MNVIKMLQRRDKNVSRKLKKLKLFDKIIGKHSTLLIDLG